MFIAVIHCTTNKESTCRIICMLCQKTSPKRWFAHVDMTSSCDVTNSVYPVTITIIRLCTTLELGRGAYNQEVSQGINRSLHATPPHAAWADTDGTTPEEKSFNPSSSSTVLEPRRSVKEMPTISRNIVWLPQPVCASLPVNEVMVVMLRLLISKLWQDCRFTRSIHVSQSRSSRRCFQSPSRMRSGHK